MKTLKFFLVALVGSIFCTGCVRPAASAQVSERDPSDQETGVCRLHGRPMTKRSVPVAYGLRIFDPGVLEVQSREFPNAIDDVGGGYVVGESSESKVFECPECRRKKNIWIKKNKDTRHVTATAISGKPGFVYSPFTGKVVDVTGLAEGAIVRDPTTSKITTEMKIFRVPAPSR